MTIATASNNAPTVIVRESGARGLDGTAGSDGDGFNLIRKSLLDNPVLHLYKKNRLANVLFNTINIDRATDGTFIDFHGILRTEAVDFPRESADGWLLEPVATNIVRQSENFADGIWGLQGSTAITSNVALSPDLSMSADRLSFTGSSGDNIIQTNSFIDNGQIFFMSIFVKNENLDSISIRPSMTGGTTIDLSANYLFATDTWTGALASTATTVHLANGWLLLTVGVTGNGTNTTLQARINSAADAVSGSCLIWGCQEDDVRASYIPTGATPEQIAAESHSINTLNNIPFLAGGFTAVVELGKYQEQSASQDLFTIPDKTSGTVFKIGTTASGKWETTIKGSDTIDYPATSLITADSDLDQSLIVTVSNIGVINLYINGALSGSATIATALSGSVDTEGKLNIAVGGDFIAKFKGLRLFDFVLNSDEITFLGG